VDRELVNAGTLYVLATPIGNLGDLSARATEILRTVSVVAAEDTRRARVLLQHIDAHPTLISVHAHSTAARHDTVLSHLADGADVGLITDAGTPAVSDPGVELVQRAREAGFAVVTVPGPSAVAAALSIAGLPADRYTFLGFLPRKGTDRRRLIHQVAENPWTCVLFEAPPRLVRLLDDLAEACGPDRPAAVARELTKIHEELESGNLESLAGYYREHPPRGEITVVVAGAGPRAATPVDPDRARRLAEAFLAEGLSRRDAATRLAAEMPMGKREAYRIVTEL
jgi:16S rRNA (cytidine1402-2'-O)-methyltransferase